MFLLNYLTHIIKINKTAVALTLKVIIYGYFVHPLLNFYANKTAIDKGTLERYNIKIYTFVALFLIIGSPILNIIIDKKKPLLIIILAFFIRIISLPIFIFVGISIYLFTITFENILLILISSFNSYKTLAILSTKDIIYIISLSGGLLITQIIITLFINSKEQQLQKKKRITRLQTDM